MVPFYDEIVIMETLDTLFRMEITSIVARPCSTFVVHGTVP